MTQKLLILKIYLVIIIMINICTSEFSKLAVDVFNVRIAQAYLITKTDFDAKLLHLKTKKLFKIKQNI